MVVILSLGLAIFAWEGMRELSHMKEEVGGEVGITGTGTGTANGWSQKVESDKCSRAILIGFLFVCPRQATASPLTCLRLLLASYSHML
ncbi:hypothetical protein V6N13_011403 [Hibiscus sabdariffa]